MKYLLQEYKKKQREIRKRLRFFRHVYKTGDREIFTELCFCILTPQSKAIVCDKAIQELQKKGMIFKGSQKDVKVHLKGVRFPNNKARYVIRARDFFKNGKDLDIKSKLDIKDSFKTRDWLVNNVKGIGYKEASHFLRNVGLGRDLAILDRHILRNLEKYGVIERIPVTLTRKKYINIEDKMRKFFKKLDISMEEIDLLFWSKETGIIFK
ncbi:MAG: N-glycosylase/DNA lyase [Candidatus Omnitrophica bacterium]|nr:N-glycosylase/DNA lyase [Candidatus Omnitrophota bacterium]